MILIEAWLIIGALMGFATLYAETQIGKISPLITYTIITFGWPIMLGFLIEELIQANKDG